MEKEKKMDRFFGNFKKFLESKIREQQGAAALNELCKKDIDGMVMRVQLSNQQMLEEVDAINAFIKQKYYTESKMELINELIDFLDVQVDEFDKD